MRSMTGFGRHEDILGGMHITVEMKSVNHRYFEFNSRMTHGYGFLEDKVKSHLQSRVSRGKIDVYVGIETLDDVSAEIAVNHSLVQGYINALKEISERYEIPTHISAEMISRYPDILTVHKAQVDEDAIWEKVRQVLDVATDKFLAMREAEGSRMKADIEEKMATILEKVAIVEERSPQTVAEYQEKLLTRLKDVLGDTTIDESRILTEAAIFADKVAVAEETVRLRSHFVEMQTMLDSDQSIGRKLDCVVQEMNRETNTIGSKATDTLIAHTVIDMKAELEKIREQIQNVE